jgi:hypothetical protein
LPDSQGPAWASSCLILPSEAGGLGNFAYGRIGTFANCPPVPKTYQLKLKEKLPNLTFGRIRGRWPPESPDQRERKIMSSMLFFFGLSMGIVFGWISMALLINFRLVWHGLVDHGSLSRQGMANALAQIPESLR